jgi:hypothetical protein
LWITIYQAGMFCIGIHQKINLFMVIEQQVQWKIQEMGFCTNYSSKENDEIRVLLFHVF